MSYNIAPYKLISYNSSSKLAYTVSSSLPTAAQGCLRVKYRVSADGTYASPVANPNGCKNPREILLKNCTFPEPSIGMCALGSFGLSPNQYFWMCCSEVSLLLEAELNSSPRWLLLSIVAAVAAAGVAAWALLR